MTLPVLVLFIAAWPHAPAVDDPKPGRGDKVVVKGCIARGVIESLDVTSQDGTKRSFGPLSFRLTGDKKLLKTLKDEHAHHSDTVRGVLKTDLPTERAGISGKVGNTGIGFGIVDPNNRTQRPLPVLEVREFEHSADVCR